LKQSFQPTHVHGPEFEDLERAFAEHAGPVIADEFEKEWSAQFSAIESLQPSGKGKEKLVELDDRNWEEEFAKFKEQEGLNGQEGGKGEWASQLEDVWKEIADKDPALAEALKNRKWEEEFDEDYFPTPGSTLDPDPVTAPCAPYHFEKENHYLSHANPLEEGVRIMESGGNLSAAALAFEAAVQRDPQNSDAWMMLGRIQAENEKEEPAVAALQRSVQENPKNLPALLVCIGLCSSRIQNIYLHMFLLEHGIHAHSHSLSHTPMKVNPCKPLPLLSAGSTPNTPTSPPTIPSHPRE
jgi:peroxin-5